MIHALPVGVGDVVGQPKLLTEILDRLVEHRPWYYDFVWEPMELRREVASAYLTDAMVNGKLWVIFRDSNLLGIFILNEIRAGLDANCHLVFFDHELRDKRHLCLSLMMQVFADEQFGLHALRVEVPEYASKLNGFLKKALGFRYESERWLASVADAKKASRKYHATCYEGRWNDSYLLSITRDEFHEWTKHAAAAEVADRAEPRVDPAGDESAPGDSQGE